VAAGFVGRNEMSQFMANYKYLIIGGGMCGDAAAHGIREVDRIGSIGLIGTETSPPYNRPPLSKSLWKGKPLDSIWRKDDIQGITFHLGRTALRLDPENLKVVDDEGTVYKFEKLLLATGSTARRLPFDDDLVIYFRTLEDYRQLRGLTEQHKKFAVIGAGFIGSEIAAALAINGKDVIMVFPGAHIGSHMFPAELAAYLDNFYEQKGVEVLSGHDLVGIESRDNKHVLQIEEAKNKHRQEITVDAVVAGIGVAPNVDLAQTVGIAVEDGIRVNSSLLTNLPNIYAAGDVADFYSPVLDKWLRVEHEDNANSMGRLAGHAMAGRSSLVRLPSVILFGSI
jgi:3-phenylpropionate/trans-cinnamate dioxygenase ferredoxin reductase component